MQTKLMLVIWCVVVLAAWAAEAAGGSQCSLAPRHQHLNQAKGVGVPCVTQCLLDSLGQPQTEAERYGACHKQSERACRLVSGSVSKWGCKGQICVLNLSCTQHCLTYQQHCSGAFLFPCSPQLREGLYQVLKHSGSTVSTQLLWCNHPAA
jgi:hypothetical protein